MFLGQIFKWVPPNIEWENSQASGKLNLLETCQILTCSTKLVFLAFWAISIDVCEENDLSYRV